MFFYFIFMSVNFGCKAVHISFVRINENDVFCGLVLWLTDASCQTTVNTLFKHQSMQGVGYENLEQIFLVSFFSQALLSSPLLCFVSSVFLLISHHFMKMTFESHRVELLKTY